MSEKKPSEIAAERRKARQEEMLKANLKRRKEQARARKVTAGEQQGDDLRQDATSTDTRTDPSE